MSDVHVAPAVRTLQRTVAHLLACVTAVALHVLDTDFRSILKENGFKNYTCTSFQNADIPTNALGIACFCGDSCNLFYPVGTGRDDVAL